MESLKKKVPKINWKYTSDKISFREHSSSGLKMVNKTLTKSSLSNFDFPKFLDVILYPMIKENIDTSASFTNINLYNNKLYCNIFI